MTFDPTKPCRTRLGLEVELFSRRIQSSQPLIGVVRRGGFESLHQWSETGDFLVSPTEHDLDLENIPERKSLWANLYPDPTAASWPNVNLGSLNTLYTRNPQRLASLEFIFDGETLLEVKVHPNLERILDDKIPF